jgi:hypothetical protein
VGLFLINIEAIHQPGEFTFLNGHDLLFGSWPFKEMFLQPFVPQAKTIPVPIKDFNHIAFSIAKNKQMAGKGVKFQMFTYQDRQTVNGFTHVGNAHGQVDPNVG